MLGKDDLAFFDPLFKPFVGQAAKVFGRAFAAGRREFRKIGRGKIKVERATVGDLRSVFDRFGICRKERLHLLGAFEVKFVGGKGGRTPFVNRGIGLDAHEDRLRFGVLAPQIMAIVGGNERQVTNFRNPDKLWQNHALFCHAVVLQFDIEMVFPKQFGIAARRLNSTFKIAFGKLFRDLSAKASRKSDQSRRVVAEQFLIHARFVVKPLGKGF